MPSPRKKDPHSFAQLPSPPYLLAFLLLLVPQLVQEDLVSLACQAPRQAPEVPLALVRQWLFLEAPLVPQVLGPLRLLCRPSLQENHEHPREKPE